MTLEEFQTNVILLGYRRDKDLSNIWLGVDGYIAIYNNKTIGYKVKFKRPRQKRLFISYQDAYDWITKYDY